MPTAPAFDSTADLDPEIGSSWPTLTSEHHGKRWTIRKTGKI